MVVSTIIVLLAIVSVPVSPAVVDIDSPSSIVTLQSSKAPVIEPIDLNRATLDELQEVPGIGPALAQRIVDFREEHGPFERVDDLFERARHRSPHSRKVEAPSEGRQAEAVGRLRRADCCAAALSKIGPARRRRNQ